MPSLDFPFYFNIKLNGSMPTEHFGGRRGIPWNAKDSAAFLNQNQLELIIRSHECVDGYKVHHQGKCVTLFSAAHYCRHYDNRGAYARFESSKHPAYKQYGPSFDPHYDGQSRR
jgi:hypothetical protein